MTRIGIFGGTFNPIHQGHLRIAGEVLEQLSLDRVIFMPSGEPPHKKDSDVVTPDHRLEMVRLAVRSHEKFEVSTLEVDRKGPSYSVDTVKELRSLLGRETELFFIVGIDAFLDVMTWKRPEELFSLCHFVVISRPGYRFSDLKGLPPLQGTPVSSLASLDRCEIRSLEGPLSPRSRLFLQTVTPCDVSATELRQRIGQGEDLKNLLPEPIKLYILKKKLYRDSSTRGV